MTFLPISVNAETAIIISDISPSYINASSNPTGVLNLTLYNNSRGEGNSLNWINITAMNVTGSGVLFDPTVHLATLTNDASSGVSLYNESNEIPGFQVTDTLVAVTPGVWTGSNPIWNTNLTGLDSITDPLPSADPGSPNYYIVIRTSSTIWDGAIFNILIEANNINATYGNVPLETFWSSNITADTQAPDTTLTVGTPKYGSSPTYVNSSTEFNLTASDGSGSGVDSIWYKIDSGSWTLYTGNFTVPTSGAHTIYYNSTDNLGQEETTKSFDIFVDNSLPDTTLTVGEPKYSSSPTYVNSSTEFNLTASDGTGSGVDSIWYKIDSGSWTLYTGNFTVPTSGAHTIYYNSSDNLEQEETTKSFDIFVDNSLPDTTLTVGEPKYSSSPTYVNSSTEFNLTASDGTGSGVAYTW
ncbi:MAG: hypothetical protein JSV56_07210, partial [Methanomassiliicoccales archaeon]